MTAKVRWPWMCDPSVYDNPLVWVEVRDMDLWIKAQKLMGREYHSARDDFFDLLDRAHSGDTDVPGWIFAGPTPPDRDYAKN